MEAKAATQPLNQYAVHLYTQVRVKVVGVMASTMSAAMEIAENAVNLHDLLDNKHLEVSTYALDNGMQVTDVEWAEGPTDFYLVDPINASGQIDYDNSRWHGPDGIEMIDGKTTVELKAARADQAAQFMQELLDSVETLTGVAEQYGVRTLADLTHLHSAILNGRFVDHYPQESQLLQIVNGLPSADHWKKAIKVAQ